MSIDAPERLNGQHETAPARVKFGPGKTQDVPAEWAEIMLTELKRGHAALFGKLLTKAADEAR
jgi:hypothetical protein